MSQPKPKAEQPKDSLGTRKGFQRFTWELQDSNKIFWLGGHAPCKIITLACLSGALHLFDLLDTASHPILILLTSMEISIIIFFTILNTFALQRYMPFILWNAAEIFNDLFSCVFLIGGIIFGVTLRRTIPPMYLIAMLLLGFAAVFTFTDLCLQRKYFKGKQFRRSAGANKTTLFPAAAQTVVETKTPEEKNN